MIRVYPAAYSIALGDGLAVDSDGKLEADVGFGDLNDGAISTPAGDDVIRFNSSTTKWSNVPQTELVVGGNF